MRQFYCDTLTRAQATLWRAWTGVQNDVHDNVDGFVPLAGIPWTPSCTNIFTPHQSDIQAVKDAFPEVHTAAKYKLKRAKEALFVAIRERQCITRQDLSMMQAVVLYRRLR